MTPRLVWPGAWRGDVAGACVVVGDVDGIASALPHPSAVDVEDSGRRKGEQLRLFLRRRGVLRRLAAEGLGVAADTLVIGYDARGAPAVRLPAPQVPSRRLFVSVTARERIAGFALAPAAVGIDLETLSDPGPIPAVLTAAERVALAALQGRDRLVMALKYWTAKEAYLKAMGVGLARDPSAIDVLAGPDEAFAMRDAAAGGPAAAGQGAWLGAEISGYPLTAAVFRTDG